jgi:chromosome segregation ATPase
MLVIGGIETNPGPHMEEKMERLLDHMMAQHEKGKRIRELLEKNKTSIETFQNTIKEFGTKIDQLSHSAKTMKEEQDKIKNLVNSWEMKEERIEGELNFVADWHRKNNLLISGIDEYLYESYLDMFKITKEFFKTKMKVTHR